MPADIDESPHPKELPAALALRLAIAKAEAVAAVSGGSDFILSADTVVACGRRALPKAENEAQARQCLSLLSGRRHRVYGGIALIRPDGILRSRLCQTVVQFKKLSGAEVESYIRSGEWRGKAGGYAIQGQGAAFVKFISGSYSNVVGLSLYDTMQMLNGSGYEKG